MVLIKDMHDNFICSCSDFPDVAKVVSEMIWACCFQSKALVTAASSAYLQPTVLLKQPFTVISKVIIFL